MSNMTAHDPHALLPQVLAYLQDNWTTIFPGRRQPRRLSAVIQGTGVGKLILYVLPGGGRRPVCIAKIPRSRRDNPSLAHEYQVVADLRRRGGSVAAAALPTPLTAFVIQGWQVVVEEVLAGRLFSGEVPTGRQLNLDLAARHLAQVRHTYVRLQLATRPDPSPLRQADIRRLFDQPIEQALRDAELRPHETHYLAALLEQAASLEERRLPLGFVHGDMRAGNILVSRSQLRLIDWQFAQLNALPMLDWFEFGFRYYCDAAGIAEITGDHDDYRAAFADVFLGAHAYTNLLRRETLACAAALGVDRRDLDLLLGMWLVDNTNKYLAFLSDRAEHGYLYLMQNPPGGPFRSYRQQLRRQVYPCLLGQLAHSRQAAALSHAATGGASDIWAAIG
jgi:Ser/Thr protein kinase RdoA (MazF antagonist)